MDLFELIALLLTLSALFSYINHRWIRLPSTIGLMVIALLFSLLLIGMGIFVQSIEQKAEKIVGSIDFNRTVMHGMLGFLLFAGALHVNLTDLRQQKWSIAALASFGVALSTLLVALLSSIVFALLGIEVRFIYCLLFGALISPTDPIAVLAILKQAGAPKDLETKIAGESLFNDGVGVVIFLGLLEIATGEYGFDPGHLAALFLQEAAGGAVLGLAMGYLAFVMLRSVDNYSVEILISLALTAGGYALALALHMSGPIAMVVAGLLVGNHGRALAMSDRTREHLDRFWELIDEILNAVLFVLIGLEVLVLTFTERFLLAGLLMIPCVLLARLVAVGVPTSILRRWQTLHKHSTVMLTWGGLRGGISVALALSIPAVLNDGSPVPERDLLLPVSYMIVIFSVVVQGLTIGPLFERLLRKSPANSPNVDSPNADSPNADSSDDVPSGI
ncbi:MAG: sodium:proton antiporter [Planctomycetaceae bacterium]